MVKNIKIEKPCLKLGYCPYGPLIEQFPLKDKRNKQSCRIFGHQCAVFYVAEGFVDKEDRKCSMQ